MLVLVRAKTDTFKFGTAPEMAPLPFNILRKYKKMKSIRPENHDVRSLTIWLLTGYRGKED